MCLAIHDLHECILYGTKAKHNFGRLRPGQVAQSVAAGLRHYRRSIPQVATARRIASILVGEHFLKYLVLMILITLTCLSKF